MVAMTYLPAIELGRRRRRILADQPGLTDTSEDLERRRRDRRRTRMPGKEEDEAMGEPLKVGEIVSNTASQWIVRLIISTPSN